MKNGVNFETMNKKLSIVISLVLAVIFLLCLTSMPYGYY